MKIAIMQPYFMPYIGYFQLINAVDKFVIYDNVNYINKGWVNRNYLMVLNKPHLFNIPLSGASQNRLINSIEINNKGNWKKKLIQTVEQSYKKSAYFDVVNNIFIKIVMSDTETISKLNTFAIVEICTYLGINTTVQLSSSIDEIDTKLKGQDKIIDICKNQGAKSYINPLNGYDLYSNDLFKSNNIDLYFLKPGIMPYKQTSDLFIPNLSVLDILMNLSPIEIRKHLESYELLQKSTNNQNSRANNE